MKLLKELGVRSNGKRGYMWALFECPKCLKTLERMKHQGVNQEQCQECFRAHHKQTQIKHGGRYTRLYRTWVNMRARCNNPKDMHYATYGALGITICEEWNDFKVFEAWAISNGYTDNLTIDRVRVKEGYSPDNCEFIPNTLNAGKDKIVISKELFAEMQTDIQNGTPIVSAYTSRNISRTAYYNAKKRYKND